MYLFFDTETTGLPKNWKAPVTDLENWPRLVQLACLLYDNSGNLISSVDYIIKPNGFTIPIESSNIHGISHERAISQGKDLQNVLLEFNLMIEQADYLVAHNISFDEKVVGAEFLRAGISNILSLKNKICTMEEATDFCAIDGPYGYKWPKLSELHFKLFGTGFEEAHNAAVDIQATAKCFWELIEIGVLKIKKETSENLNNSKNQKYTGETKEIHETLLKFCKDNQLEPIPVAAQAKAIGFLEMKLKQSQQYTFFENESKFLRDFWAKNDSLSLNQYLKSHQEKFILEIKKEIIDNNLDFKLLKGKSFEEASSSIELFGVMYSIENEIPRKLVINLYYHFLTRYFDSVPIEIKNKKIEKSPDVSEIEKAINSIIDTHAADLKTSTNGGIPERIYNLVESVNIELKKLALITTTFDDTYIEYSDKIIFYSSSLILDWSKEMKQHLTIPISGMKLGNTFVEVCENIFKKISEVEASDASKKILNEKIYEFEILKLQIGAKSNSGGGCFIATAVYGNYDQPSVLDLRLFRDNYLSNTHSGRLFIKWYYKNSPSLSLVIRRNVILKGLAYIFIIKPVHFIVKTIFLVKKKNSCL